MEVIGKNVSGINTNQQAERLFAVAPIRGSLLRVARPLVLAAVFLGLAGCSRFHPLPKTEYVYVTAKQTFLRDRVAAVSNRTATVDNGQRLTVLERGRRFIKVRTDKGEIGWIDDKVVATGEVVTGFDTMKDEHKNDPVVASGVVRDEVYMHLTPGRETERFYRLAEGEKLSLLRRATLVKTANGAATTAHAQKAIPQAVGSSAAKKPAETAKAAAVNAPDAPPPPPPVMEDWWLVRDTQGHTGWLYSHMVDVDAPDSIARYAEGQRIVGAYVLTKIHDSEAGEGGAGLDVPIYVTVMSPYKAGLPYDFDQVRVFTWSLKKHRYETGFREHNIEGYLPVTIRTAPDSYSKPGSAQAAPAPTFTYKVLAADAPPVVPDPTTGAMVPTKTVTRTFRLEGNVVRRVSPPNTPPDAVAHPEPIEEKKDKKRRR